MKLQASFKITNIEQIEITNLQRQVIYSNNFYSLFFFLVYFFKDQCKSILKMLYICLHQSYLGKVDYLYILEQPKNYFCIQYMCYVFRKKTLLTLNLSCNSVNQSHFNYGVFKKKKKKTQTFNQKHTKLLLADFSYNLFCAKFVKKLFFCSLLQWHWIL